MLRKRTSALEPELLFDPPTARSRALRRARRSPALRAAPARCRRATTSDRRRRAAASAHPAGAARGAPGTEPDGTVAASVHHQCGHAQARQQRPMSTSRSPCSTRRSVAGDAAWRSMRAHHARTAGRCVPTVRRSPGTTARPARDKPLEPDVEGVAAERPGVVGRSSPLGERAEEHHAAHTLGMIGRQAQRDGPTLAGAEQPSAFDAGVVEDRVHVACGSFDGAGRTEPLRQAEPTPVEHNHAVALRQSRQELAQARILPGDLDVRDEAGTTTIASAASPSVA